MDAICSTVGASPWRSFTIAWICANECSPSKSETTSRSGMRQDHDLIGEATRIPQGDEAPAILLDRERLQVAEPGPILGHGAGTSLRFEVVQS